MPRLILFVLPLLALSSTLIAQSGVVRSGDQAIPGASVVSSQGDKKATTITDQNGHYAFTSLGEGVWTIQVTMFGFEPAKRNVNSAAAKADFELKLRESPAARRLLQFAGGRPGAQNGNQADSQLQNELNSTPQQAEAQPAQAQSSNESFLVTGSLSQGLSAAGQPDLNQGPGPGRYGAFG